MNQICGIYAITNLVNGKMIIGQSADIYRRWKDYRVALRGHRYKNIHLQRAWDKYGENNFQFHILILCSIDNLDGEEIRLIKKYGTTNPDFGYNIESGGNRSPMTEETRRKLSKANIGKIISAETRRKISNANKGQKRSFEFKQKMREMKVGNKNPNFGKPHSEEHKKKLSCAQKGKPKSEDTKLRMKLAWEKRKQIHKILEPI